MDEKVTNSTLLQAIMELSDQQKETADRVNSLSDQVKSLSEQQKKTSNQVNSLSDQVKSLSQQLKDTDKRLTERIGMVDAKIDILSNRLLETQAEVNILKGVK